MYVAFERKRKNSLLPNSQQTCLPKEEAYIYENALIFTKSSRHLQLYWECSTILPSPKANGGDLSARVERVCSNHSELV
jgi:hypothetical protein